MISVIVPVYNVEPFLKRCVKSIMKQTYRDIEIILVNDGSTDNCFEICTELQKEDSRIKVINKKNQGLGAARNSGLSLSKGEYVTFVDSDDWISESHIERLFRTAARSLADAVIGSYTRVYSDGRKKIIRANLAQGTYEGERQIVSEIVLPLIGSVPESKNDVQLEASVCMNLYRTDVIRKHGMQFLNERKIGSEDLFFNLDFFMHSSRVEVSDEVGYFYFENRNSISRAYDRRRIERVNNCYSETIKWISDFNLSEKIGYRADRTYLMKVRSTIRAVVSSSLPINKKIQEISYILDQDVTESVLARYPIGLMHPAIRLLAIMMRSKCALGVYVIMLMKEWIERHEDLKELIKKMGHRGEIGINK